MPLRIFPVNIRYIKTRKLYVWDSIIYNNVDTYINSHDYVCLVARIGARNTYINTRALPRLIQQQTLVCDRWNTTSTVRERDDEGRVGLKPPTSTPKLAWRVSGQPPHQPTMYQPSRHGSTQTNYRQRGNNAITAVSQPQCQPRGLMLQLRVQSPPGFTSWLVGYMQPYSWGT